MQLPPLFSSVQATNHFTIPGTRPFLHHHSLHDTPDSTGILSLKCIVWTCDLMPVSYSALLEDSLHHCTGRPRHFLGEATMFWEVSPGRGRAAAIPGPACLEGGGLQTSLLGMETFTCTGPLGILSLIT